MDIVEQSEDEESMCLMVGHIGIGGFLRNVKVVAGPLKIHLQPAVRYMGQRSQVRQVDRMLVCDIFIKRQLAAHN